MVGFYYLFLIITFVLIEYVVFKVWIAKGGDSLRNSLALLQLIAAVTTGFLGQKLSQTSPLIALVGLVFVFYFILLVGIRRAQRHRISGSFDDRL